jgi:hypothetical protein
MFLAVWKHMKTQRPGLQISESLFKESQAWSIPEKTKRTVEDMVTQIPMALIGNEGESWQKSLSNPS